MDNEAAILLDDVITFCERDGLEPRLINMLKQSQGTSLDDESFTVEVPSRFAYSYLIKQREVIERYLEEITFAPLSLSIVVAGGTSAPVQRAAGETAANSVAAPTQPAETPITPAPATGAPIVTPEERDPSTVKVNNTMTPEMFRQMMSSMKDGTSSSATSAPRETIADKPAVEEEPEQDTLDSKFTFDTFVYGPENKHAFHSAQRFAAFAEEPGQCTSLFIYGKSGLGKTHLLIAIKNYLRAEKPYIRVKYANSQTYIDNFIKEVAKQKNDGHNILREYHDADVLIIDDIQNIIGKQASIDYFFSLMDEFIRENKKVVIASDRAPKDLGMDERLTSRFSAGMLCLVSVPGFEMKLQILRNYYERTLAAQAKPVTGGLSSLIDGLEMHKGKLTDEHFKHMAEVSGNNIRELESFCERCAAYSYECEEEGRELTAEDIDRIASEYFDISHKVISIRTVQSVVEEYYQISHEDLIGRKRQKNIAQARHVAVYLINSMCEPKTQSMIGEAFGRDHSTVIHSIKLVETRIKEEASFAEEMSQLRNKIQLKS
jgi:chromosomal replication initiator protein